MAEARRLGGVRRRKEGTLGLIFELPNLGSLEGLRRLHEIVVSDALALDPGAERLRILLSGIDKGIRLIEGTNQEARIAAIEAVIARLNARLGHQTTGGSVLDGRDL